VNVYLTNLNSLYVLEIEMFSFYCSFKGKSQSSAGRDEEKTIVEPEVLMTKEIEWSNNWEHSLRERDIRQGIDLATTLERIEKNFVISDPRLPDNPIVRQFFSLWLNNRCLTPLNELGCLIYILFIKDIEAVLDDHILTIAFGEFVLDMVFEDVWPSMLGFHSLPHPFLSDKCMSMHLVQKILEGMC